MAQNLLSSLYDTSYPPIVSRRAPTARDRAEIGTIWVDKTLNDAYILTSVVNGLSSWINAGGGGGTFATLNVTGATVLGGAITASTFGVGILRSSAAGVITSTAGTDGQLIIGSTGLAPVWATLTAGAGIGIVNAAGAITITAPGATAVSYTTDDLNVVLPDGAGNVNVVGGLNIGTTGAIANTITINLDPSVTLAGKLTAGNDLEMQAGTCTITSDDNAANAIYLHANGGVNETIHLYSENGTAANSIFLEALCGGIVVDSSFANADAIHLHSSNAAGGISMAAGTGGEIHTITNGVFTVATGTGAISIGADATQHNMTLGSITGTSGVIIQSGTGDVAVTSTDDITLDCAGALDLNSTAGDINIGNDANSFNINIGTGAAARTVSIGNTDTTSSTIVYVGTGNLDLGYTATDHATRIGSATGTSSLAIRAGTGVFTSTAGGAYDVNAAGAVTIDSSGSTIGIGVDANAFGINIGTGAAQRNIIIGNATGTTSVVVNGGTGAMQFGANAIAHDVTVGSVTAAANTSILAGTGLLNLASLGSSTYSAVTTLDIDTGGALSLNSSAGVINIGNDAVNQAINIGGGGERTVTIGGATTASSVVVQVGTGPAYFGANATEHTTVVGSITTASHTTVQGGTGGIDINAGGLVRLAAGTDTQAGTGVTINTNVGYGIFTGLTTAAAAAEVLTVTNSLCTANSVILCTLSNFGANDGQMTVTRVVPAAGSFTVTATNFGAAALNGNIVLSFWLLKV